VKVQYTSSHRDRFNSANIEGIIPTPDPTKFDTVQYLGTFRSEYYIYWMWEVVDHVDASIPDPDFA